ncbi:hypothetical protein V501_06591 [Pseudogymnoascus sp. VKM F-4519 (FW-2642)]|nr:hypothetical protein V501_06591 [Pseudogymnoascus sp. VKM F-4519 (FW-2642)]
MDSDTEYTEYRTDVSETDIASPARPGRFKGPKSTWRTFNEDEIALAESLVKLEAQDLSAHLYNAHVMKKSLYDPDLVKEAKPWASKERWRPAEVGDDGKNFVPPERWTAWPLEPEIVPRSERPKADEEFTLKRVEEEKPSREMEEVLTGVMLKFAKNTFERRKWETEEALQISSDGESDSDPQEAQEENPKEDDHYPTDSEAPTQPSLSHPPPSKPIISADDDRSARLLRPTIRHTITRLDNLLTALQISRRACLRPDRSPSPTADPLFPTVEPEDVPSTPDSPKRRQGRPRRVISDQPHPLAAASPPKKSNRGRKKKVHAPLPGETQTEMLVRIAREQHKSIPFAVDSPRSSTSRSTQSRSRSRSMSRSRSRSSSRGSRARLGARDWSEVIGAAALVGWPEDVVERAGRRCATLFGEGMGVRVFTEGVMGGDVKEEMYVPEEVPDFGEMSEEGEEEEMVEEAPTPRRSRSARPESRPRSRSRSRESRSRMDERSAVGKFGVYAAYCPLQECERYQRGFNSERAVRDHLRINHRMGKEEIQKMEEEEDMIGGVHRDGFGVMVKRRPGWRGVDEGLRKERKKRGRGGSGAVDESVVGDESEEEGMRDSLKNEYF